MKSQKTTSELQAAWGTGLPNVRVGTEHPLATIVDALPVLVSYIDAGHRYQFLNKTYERWFGGSRDAAVGKTVMEVLGPALFERLKEPLARALAGETVKAIIPAFAPALGDRQFEATFTPDIGPDGVVRGTVDLVTDVTDRLALERAQEEALQVNAERERLIGELTQNLRLNELFTGVLGHDLRNPLGAILMSATVLSRKATDPALVRTAGRILTAGQRMNRMIAQLLDFTRVRGAGTLPIQRTRLDLATVMRQAIDEIPESAAGEGVRLEPVGDTQGWWDGDRLTQAGSNLVSNALRHGDPGEVVVRIEGDDPGHVTLSVRNRGTIPDSLLPVIWEPFQQGVLRERRSGLGLGLFITREIATAHAGSVQIESQPATGSTTFFMRLPRGNPPTA